MKKKEIRKIWAAKFERYSAQCETEIKRLIAEVNFLQKYVTTKDAEIQALMDLNKKLREEAFKAGGVTGVKDPGIILKGGISYDEIHMYKHEPKVDLPAPKDVKTTTSYDVDVMYTRTVKMDLLVSDTIIDTTLNGITEPMVKILFEAAKSREPLYINTMKITPSLSTPKPEFPETRKDLD